MNPIQQALSLISELDTLRPIAPELEARVMQKLRLDWNYHSNHLEGNSLTYGETKALILHGITAQGKPLKDHTEVEGHNEAVKWVYEIAKDDRPLTESFIRELHTLLLVKPYKVRAETAEGVPTWKVIQVGRYKESNNHVFTKTGEKQEFLPFQETPKAMQDLIDWYASEKSKLDVNPIVLATSFHHKFIAIHPFDDGNGRTVRLLMNYIFMQFGYPPVIIKTEDKDRYFSVLQAANSGNIEPFLEFITDNLNRSLRLMISGAKGENIEEPDDLDKEIALLEQKIKHNLGGFQQSRTPDLMEKAIFPMAVKIYNSFMLQATKFEKFYTKQEKQIIMTAPQSQYDLSKLEFSHYAKYFRECTTIDLTINYLSNIYTDYTQNHSSKITILFNALNFEIKTSKGDVLISKSYADNEISEEELHLILKPIADDHLFALKNNPLSLSN